MAPAVAIEPTINTHEDHDVGLPAGVSEAGFFGFASTKKERRYGQNHY